MALVQPGSAEAARIDAAVQSWRQGDAALLERWFVHTCDPRMPLTDSAAASADEIVTSEVEGLVVTTQSCDIIRSCTDRPFVEVSPLIRVDAKTLGDVRRGFMPRFAFLPGTSDRSLVVELDRSMTVEKSCVEGWARTPGLSSDDEAREFAEALARKRQRFAFPNEFTALMTTLQKRIRDKHDRDSPEGRSLRALREIRVQALPAWDSPRTELMFWFVRNESAPDFEGMNWGEAMAKWLKLVPPSGRFVSVEGQVCTLVEMTGADYRYSDRLDLDHLSETGGREW